MKKIFFAIIIAATALTSCVIESYDKPSRTIIGYNISEYVSYDIRTASSIADLVRVIDMWLSATTEQEKFDIEDKYFGNYVKLREHENVVTVVGYYEVKTLVGSKWEVTSLEDNIEPKLSYEVSLTGVNEYKIKALNNTKESFGEFTLQVITPDLVYSISGSGKSTIAPFSPIKTALYDKIEYSITTPMKFTFRSAGVIVSRWHSSNPRQQQGVVDIDIYKYKPKGEVSPYKATAKYLPQGVEISYRGFTDFYNYYGYVYE